MKRNWRQATLVVAGIILVAAVLVTGCSVPEWAWEHSQAMALEITSPTFSTRDGYSMLVLYLRDGNYYLMTITGTHDFVVEGDFMYVDEQELPACDVTKVGWGLYPEQPINIPMEYNPDTGLDEPVPITMEELNLRDFEAEDLPQSGHFARLDAVDPQASWLKIEVSRPFYGKWYGGIKCLVLDSLVRDYQSGYIELGDYLWIYYTNDPREGHENEEIPVAVGVIAHD